MSAGVSPDVDTFDSVLFVLRHHRQQTVVRSWSLHVVNEMNKCGLGMTVAVESRFACLCLNRLKINSEV